MNAVKKGTVKKVKFPLRLDSQKLYDEMKRDARARKRSINFIINELLTNRYFPQQK